MDQADSEPENKEASFHRSEENDDITAFGEGEGKTEEEEYIQEEQDDYSSDENSELNDNSIENQKVIDQDGATVRDYATDENNEDMEQLDERKIPNLHK